MLAVLAGVGVDLTSTEIAYFGYGVLADALALRVPDLFGGDLDAAMGLAIGLACTVLGGFTAAWVANRRELLHGLLFGIATMLVAEAILLVPAVAPEGSLPPWRQLVWYVLALPAALAGAALRRARKRRAEIATN